MAFLLHSRLHVDKGQELSAWNDPEGPATFTDTYPRFSFYSTTINMNKSQARIYLRKESRKNREGSRRVEPNDSQGMINAVFSQPPTPSATFHPPVMGGHCARMYLAGRRDSCSGVQHPFFEEPVSMESPAQLLDEVKARWEEIFNTVLRPGSVEKHYDQR
ncbi:hypothetical protein V8B97DRAFT_1916595 [Scleroderma yunnanense]